MIATVLNMFPALFAQVVQQGGHGDWSLLGIIIAVIIIAAACAILIIILRVMGYEIPRWVWHILGIVAVAFVGILALKILWSMW